MTNRQALMRQLETLSNDDFIATLLTRSSDLPERIDQAVCEACAARFGPCRLLDSDESCPMSVSHWLDMEHTTT